MEELLNKKIKKRGGHRLFIRNILSSYKELAPKDNEPLSDEGRLKLESIEIGFY